MNSADELNSISISCVLVYGEWGTEDVSCVPTIYNAEFIKRTFFSIDGPML